MTTTSMNESEAQPSDGGRVEFCAVSVMTSMSVAYNGLAFERLGHASVRIETSDDRFLYIDPWSEVLGDRQPHDADVVFVTHDDFDHYDPDAIERVSTPETTIVADDGVDTSALATPEAVWALSDNEDLTVVAILPSFISVPVSSDITPRKSVCGA